MGWSGVGKNGVDGKGYLLTSISRFFTGSCTFFVKIIRVKLDSSTIALKINESHYVILCL